MPFIHVLAKVEGTFVTRVLFEKLSQYDLKKAFVSPYTKGKSFFCGNELTDPSDLIFVKIIKTQNSNDEERKSMKNEDLSVFTTSIIHLLA